MNFIQKYLNKTYVVASILFAIFFISKLIFINSRDICLDEPFTIFYAQKSAMEILMLPSQTDPFPPLFMFLLHFVIKIFGLSTCAIRLLPLFFNSLTVVFIYLSGKKFFGQFAGIVSSCLFLLSSYHFYFGLEARAYSTLSFAASASFYYYLSLVKEPEKKSNFILLLLSNLVLIYSHYFGFFVVFMEFVSSFLFIKSNRNILKKIWLVILLTFVTYAPMIVIFVKQFLKSKEGTWVTPPAKSEYINQIFLFLNSYSIVFYIFLLSTIIVLFFMILNKKLFDKKIIYYQDGSTFIDNNNTIFKFLNSKYNLLSSISYPECFQVSIFENEKKDSLENTNH